MAVSLSREESSLFPRFKVHVQDSLETIFSRMPVENSMATFAAIIAFIIQCNENSDEIQVCADEILCNILKSVHHSEIGNWNLGSLLRGKWF